MSGLVEKPALFTDTSPEEFRRHPTVAIGFEIDDNATGERDPRAGSNSEASASSSKRDRRRIELKDQYKFFGEVALERKFVTPEQLYEALTVQARTRVDGHQEKLLGQILLELGHMDEHQIAEVLDVLYPVSNEA